jgi:hypothetical protein
VLEKLARPVNPRGDDRSGRLRLRVWGSQLHLDLAPQNRAPRLVLGDGHAAFHADPDALLRWLAALSQQTLQQ